MKPFVRKILVYFAVIFMSIVAILVILDDFILPYYVSAKELKVPSVVGLNKDAAIEKLKEFDLNPIIQTSRYNEKYQKDEVIFQRPNAGTIVKVNRRIYLTVSGGEPLIKMPQLINKSIRDAIITLDRMGLKISKIDSVKSELPANTVVEQQFPEGTSLVNGDSVEIKVSVGPNIGMIRVPNILGKSLDEAERILRSNSIKLGKLTYIHSATILPNTVVDQQPSENALIQVGDSINVVITQTKQTDSGLPNRRNE